MRTAWLLALMKLSLALPAKRGGRSGGDGVLDKISSVRERELQALTLELSGKVAPGGFRLPPGQWERGKSYLG